MLGMSSLCRVFLGACADVWLPCDLGEAGSIMKYFARQVQKKARAQPFETASPSRWITEMVWSDLHGAVLVDSAPAPCLCCSPPPTMHRRRERSRIPVRCPRASDSSRVEVENGLAVRNAWEIDAFRLPGSPPASSDQTAAGISPSLVRNRRLRLRCAS